MAAPLAPLSSMVAAKLISSSTKVAAKVKVGDYHQQASFFDNVNIIGNIPTVVSEMALSMIKKRRNNGVSGEILQCSDPWVAIQIPVKKILYIKKHIFNY